MQSKLSSFFKPCSSSPPKPSSSSYPSSCDVTTYSRKQRRESAGEAELRPVAKPVSGETSGTGRDLNKKRSYAQLYLEFGQSDFNFRNCSACGWNYSPGDEKDEKDHNVFHRDYTRGIQFRGWQNERVIPIDCSEGDRVVLVLDSDPSPRKSKVKEVIKMMEIELGEGWIIHELCKVYLYVSSNRITGCLVAEPIKEAFRIISSSVDKQTNTGSSGNGSRSEPKALKFGDVVFKREAVKRIPSARSREGTNSSHYGAMVCEERGVPASCGIRAIWVTPSNRRKGIATRLLDAARESFCTGCSLDRSQIAFSPPTSAGRPLAYAYIRNEQLLLYKADPVPV
ncbi:Protein CHROMOSOME TRANSMISSION FIDELITY 7 [Linum perenne]